MIYKNIEINRSSLIQTSANKNWLQQFFKPFFRLQVSLAQVFSDGGQSPLAQKNSP